MRDNEGKVCTYPCESHYDCKCLALDVEDFDLGTACEITDTDCESCQ